MPDLNFIKGMKAEHCARKDSREVFQTSNYKIKPCTLEEWNLVIENWSMYDNQQSSSAHFELFFGPKGAETMLEKATKEQKMGYERRIPQLDDLKQEAVVINSKLRLEEILAVVLYTGPMVTPFCFWSLLKALSFMTATS